MISNRFWGPLISAMFLFILYFVVALRQHNFALPNFNYIEYQSTFIYGIPNLVFQSYFWKIIFLFPATILFSLALTRGGVRFSLPVKINYRLIVGVVLVTATIILILSVQFLFRETEVTDDENAYDFQAQTLLAGRLVNPPPPVAGKGVEWLPLIETSFDNIMIINDGRLWVGKYTLGHPIIIAIGMALGNRYIVTIGISILTLLLVYLIAVKLYNNKKIALLAFCLGAVSPFFYFVSSSRLSHTTSGFFLALFMYLFLHIREMQNTPMKAVMTILSGLALGYAFNVRPLTALGFSLPFIFIMIMDFRQFPKRTFLTGLFLSLSFSVMLILTLWYNAIVTGNPLLFPFSYYYPGESVGLSILHTPYSALHNLAVNLVRLNGTLFGFPISLIFVIAFFFAKKEFGDRLAFGILGSIACAYMFYFSPGVQDLGPVYYYETLIPLLLLSARGIQYLNKIVSIHFEHGKTFVLNFLITSCLVAYGSFVPERVSHIARLTEQIRKPYEIVQSANIHHALVMIELSSKHGGVSGCRNSSPEFTDDVIYCLYTNNMVSNRAVVNYFSDRSPYILRLDSTKQHFELLPVDRNNF